MQTSQWWRDQAKMWRLMAESGQDSLLHSQLMLLAEEADAIAAEIDAETATSEEPTGLDHGSEMSIISSSRKRNH
jgi:hypothetical protein